MTPRLDRIPLLATGGVLLVLAALARAATGTDAAKAPRARGVVASHGGRDRPTQ